MKRLGFLAVLAAAATGAEAALNLNIDIAYQTVSLPSSGTLTVTFTGTVDVLLPAFDVSAATLEFPFMNSTTGLIGTFHPDFITYLSSSAPGVDYAGNLFTIDVPSTAAQGSYIFDGSGTTLSEFIVTATNGTVDASDQEFYGVTVVPEPATLAALGIGAAALIRRRRKA